MNARVRGRSVKPRVCLRLGIHTGRVISGVVGQKRPQFSLFGDTVNTSSRMQSTGVINEIHCSKVTYRELRKDYNLEAKRTYVKGKGMMDTFLLRERTTKRPIAK